MAQAALAAEENPGQAMNLLDKARLMMPGTLIEDAALRRGLILAEKLLDTGKFEALAREYIWRFPRSDYFESFRRQSSSAVTRFILDGEAGDFERIEKLVDLIDPANQCGFYLQTAYQGIIDGKIAAAHRAAIKGRKLARDGTVEQGRAALYNAAALILMGNIETGTNELALANTVQLPRQDEDLKEQVALLISQIGDPAEDPFITSNQVGTAGSHDGTSAAGQAAGLIDLAQKKLAQAVDVIQGKDP
ncbi:MAG: hypothetical protein J2P49_05990 [Methylocapsa sp.]|nr:hypothetical protein [Methylocapsa sp.]